MAKGDDAGLPQTLFDSIHLLFRNPGAGATLPTEADCRDILSALAREEFAANNPGSGTVGVVHMQKALDDVQAAFNAAQNNLTAATITDLKNKLLALGALEQQGVVGFLSKP